MIKISRRGYSQHIRLLCLTTDRLYNITKTDPYAKECVLIGDVRGITVTPYKDGFMCIHTKETYEDRVKFNKNLLFVFFLEIGH